MGSHHSPVCFCVLAFWESSPPGKPRHLPSLLDSQDIKGVQNSHSELGFPGGDAQSSYEAMPAALRCITQILANRCEVGDTSQRQQLGLHLGKDTHIHSPPTHTHTLRKLAHSAQLPLYVWVQEHVRNTTFTILTT